MHSETGKNEPIKQEEVISIPNPGEAWEIVCDIDGKGKVYTHRETGRPMSIHIDEPENCYWINFLVTADTAHGSQFTPDIPDEIVKIHLDNLSLCYIKMGVLFPSIEKEKALDIFIKSVGYGEINDS